jgi:hypothetical protein
MLCLAAADTVAGVAQTAATLTFTMFGMELNGSTEDYKVLFQGQLPAAAATQYTAPASTTTFVKSMAVVNTSAAASQTFQLFRGGTAAANAITPSLRIPAGGMAVYEDGFGWQLLDASGIRQEGNSTTTGLEYLGSTVLSVAAASTSVVTIPARDYLEVYVRVSGYGGSDIASLRFNGDTANNYWSRYLNSAAGGAVLANNQNVSQAMARLFAAGTTLGRAATVGITNRQANSKVGVVNGNTATNAAGTAGSIEFGGFEWVNTAAQITSIQMLTPGGQTMSAGSGFEVYGMNF